MMWRIHDGTKQGYTDFEATEETTLDLSFPSSKTRRGRVKEGVTPTLDTSCEIGVFDKGKVRLISSREAWRLQGFPDWAYEKAKDAGVSEANLRKQAGNSVTVSVIHAVGSRLT